MNSTDSAHCQSSSYAKAVANIIELCEFIIDIVLRYQFFATVCITLYHTSLLARYSTFINTKVFKTVGDDVVEWLKSEGAWMDSGWLCATYFPHKGPHDGSAPARSNHLPSPLHN